MANDFTTQLARLLAGQLPQPARPMPMMLPATSLPAPAPFQEPMPTAAPPAPLGALDQNLIAQLAGPAPIQRQPGALEKLAAILQGIGAGAQGQGPQFAESLRAQRERPQREYEARRLAGVEIAERKREREQTTLQRRADTQSDREFDMWLKQANITDQDAKERAREAFTLQKIREQERVFDERQQIQQKSIDERQRRTIESQLVSKDGASPAIAKELSEYSVGMRDTLSQAAQQWRGAQARKAEAQISRLERLTRGRAGVGGTGNGFSGVSQKAVQAAQRFEATKKKLIEAYAVGDARGQKELTTALQTAFRGLARFPELEAGYSGGSPYVKLRTPRGSVGLVQEKPASPMSGPAQPGEFSEADVPEYVRQFGVSAEQARKELALERQMKQLRPGDPVGILKIKTK